MAAPTPRRIRFGTSGWRGILGEEVTTDRVRAAARAVGEWVAASRSGGRVLVAHDTRFAGARFAELTAGILVECGLEVRRAPGPVPTPVVTHGLLRQRAAAAIVFTASHNPASDHGMKVFGATGGSAAPEETQRIEARAAAALADPRRETSAGRRPSRCVDLLGPYLEDLVGLLDRGALKRSGLRVFYDAMHGSGSGVLDAALRRTGVRVSALRRGRDLHFGGCAPDPLPARLGELARAVRRAPGLRLGLATDGDADRYAVVDADGRALSETHAVALLVDHLGRTGRVRTGVAVSLATGSLVERVAADHGLAVERHPIGFKFLSPALASGRADVAGEESGGFALGRFGRDKDGILAGCLLAEIAAAEGAPLRRRLRRLERRHGASACGRTVAPADERAREALAELSVALPDWVDGRPVRSASRIDGVRLSLDDGFLMLRASGTERVVRVYAEARGRRGLQRRLRLGLRWLGAER